MPALKSSMKNYYSLLGVDSKATKAEIKKNYRLLANKYHPDKNPDPSAASKFIVITEAYDVLTNKKRRTEYDLMRWEMLKRKQSSRETESIVRQPRETTRTKRNKAQQKRSIKYHQESSQMKKQGRLLYEALIVASRYFAAMIGFVLLVVILVSAYKELPGVFESGFGKGVILSLLLVLFVYILVKITQYIIEELKKDIEAFTVFYRLSFAKIAFLTVSVFVLVYLSIAFVLYTLY